MEERERCYHSKKHFYGGKNQNPPKVLFLGKGGGALVYFLLNGTTNSTHYTHYILYSEQHILINLSSNT